MFERLNNGFNFIVYLFYLPFVLIRKMGCKPGWKYFTALWETMGEIRKMTDMCRMMQRFIYMDRVFKVLLNADQRRLLHLQEKETIEEVEKERNHYKLYKKMGVRNLAMPLIVIKGGLRKNTTKNDEYNGIGKEQFEVIQSYVNLR